MLRSWIGLTVSACIILSSGNHLFGQENNSAQGKTNNSDVAITDQDLGEKGLLKSMVELSVALDNKIKRLEAGLANAHARLDKMPAIGGVTVTSDGKIAAKFGLLRGLKKSDITVDAANAQYKIKIPGIFEDENFVVATSHGPVAHSITLAKRSKDRLEFHVHVGTTPKTADFDVIILAKPKN